MLPEAAWDELREFATVTIEQGLSLIAHWQRYWPLWRYFSVGVRGRITGAYTLICQGASRHNLCFLVTYEQAENIIKNFMQNYDGSAYFGL